MGRLLSFVQNRARLILALGLILSLVGGYFTVRLYQNLRTDLEELLPTTSRSVKDLNEVTQRLRSIDNLAVLAFSKDTQASKRFVVDLAAKLQSLPKSDVADVEYRIDRELAFFQKRQALYMDLGDLTEIRNFVRDRIEYEKEIRNPLTLLLSFEKNMPEPELDFRQMRKKYESRERDYTRFPDGFFATPDETKRVVLIDVPGKTLGVDGMKRVKSEVEAAVEGLHPGSYAPDLHIHYTGSVEEMLEEQDALVEDLGVSTIAVIVMVSVAMLLFFRSLWATAALVASLIASTLWTFGAAYFMVGYLNANSAFLGSIVLGNGINFAIIILARYLEEKRLGCSHFDACVVAIPTTAKATLAAALAAGLSYGSLMLTSFRGFSQFGAIGFVGMVLCWISSYTLLPALLWVLDQKGLLASDRLPERNPIMTRLAAGAVSKYPKQIAAVAGILTIAALSVLPRAGGDLLETNLEHLRSKKSTQNGAAFYTQYLNQIFQRFLTPIVIMPSTREHALEIATKLKAVQHREGPESPIVSVQTIDDFVPKDQERKIALLHDIQERLPKRIVAEMSDEDRNRVKEFLTPEAFKPMSIDDLPPLVREKFKEKDGSLGKLVLVEPPLTKEIWKGENLTRFITELRSVTDSVESGAPVAGGMPITADLVSSISRDGPKATLMAFLSVVFLVMLLFREPRTVSQALAALLLGVTWFSGTVVAFSGLGLKINFLNFVALPITFGIGVDYGVNIFQRYRYQRKGGIARVIRETGGAVGLSSLTTIIGYSSLLMASNRGFVSFGLLAVLGEITCVTAAVVALPAILLLFVRRKEEEIVAEVSEESAIADERALL